MVAVVSIDTGKVLDVIFLSNSCVSCEQKKREQREGKISKKDFLNWFVSHEEDCYLIHEGSSQVCHEFNFLSKKRGENLKFHRQKDCHNPFIIV